MLPMKLRHIAFALAALLALPAHAEEIRIGTVKLVTAGSLFIAQEKGYFAAEGLDAKFSWFDAPGPVIQALVAGDIDIGTTGSSADARWRGYLIHSCTRSRITSNTPSPTHPMHGSVAGSRAGCTAGSSGRSSASLRDAGPTCKSLAVETSRWQACPR